MKRWRRILLALVSAALLTTTATAAVAAGTNTWADYSLMFGRYAGQARDAANTPVSQWAWEQQSPTASNIRWGDPNNWNELYPYKEHFQVDPAGGWVYLDGWEDNGTYYKLSMTAEFSGPNCSTLAPIPVDGAGRQHYVKWVVPTASYCLYGVGVITEQLTGKRILFTHQQTWNPPATCNSIYQGNALCISQSERWADNNRGDLTGPVQETLVRTQYLALGRGMAYRVEQSYPSQQTLYGYATWQY